VTFIFISNFITSMNYPRTIDLNDYINPLLDGNKLHSHHAFVLGVRNTLPTELFGLVQNWHHHNLIRKESSYHHDIADKLFIFALNNKPLINPHNVRKIHVVLFYCQKWNYLCNQCLSSLMLWVRISIRERYTILCSQVCQ
jgi:hypothetical protein